MIVATCFSARTGDPVIAKRKPPSQRSERQLDDQARAIAQAREAAKPEKTSDEEKSARDNNFTHVGRVVQGASARKSGSPAPSAITKRNKSGGG